MPFPNVPTEIRDKYAQIYEQIKKDNPTWSKEKVAKITWSMIKKMYYKDKNGKWHPKDKTASWVYDDKNFQTAVRIFADVCQKDIDDETIIGGSSLDKEKYLVVRGPATLVQASQISELLKTDKNLPSLFEAAGDWKRKLIEQAGFNYDDVSKKMDEADYLYVENWLCHADLPNANKLEFPAADLQFALRSGQFSPYRPVIVDINHTEVPMLGFSLGAYLQPDERADGRLGLKVISVLLNWGPYKEAGSKVIEADQKQELAFSMSCIPEYCSCKLCGYLSHSRWDSCEHVLDPENKDGILIAHYPKFFTNSIILPPKKPADRLATPVEITASEDNDNPINTPEESMDELKKLQAEFEKLERKYEEASKRLEEFEKSKDAEAQEAVKAELETLKTAKTDLEKEIADLKSANQTKDERITELEAANKALKEANEKFEAAERERAEQAAKAKLEERNTQINKLVPDMDETEKKYFEARAQNDSDEDWKVLVASIEKRIKPATKPDETDPVIREKLEASEQLRNPGNSPNAPKSKMDALTAAVDRNLL